MNRWIVGHASSLSPGASSPSSFRGQDARGDRLLQGHEAAALAERRYRLRAWKPVPLRRYSSGSQCSSIAGSGDHPWGEDAEDVLV